MRWITALSIAVAACQAPAELPTVAEEPAPAAAPQVSLRVEGDGRAEGFTLATRHLDVSLGWDGADGRRVVLEIYAPGGATYQRETRTVDAGKAAMSVPIAGTHASEFGLAGDWEVRAYAEGEALPLASAEFSIGAP